MDKTKTAPYVGENNTKAELLRDKSVQFQRFFWVIPFICCSSSERWLTKRSICLGNLQQNMFSSTGAVSSCQQMKGGQMGQGFAKEQII